MKIQLNSPNDLGAIVKASRKHQALRQDDAAGSIGVSENFLGKVERGSDSVMWGKLFQVLDGLGIYLSADVPDAVAQRLGLEVPATSNRDDIKPSKKQSETIVYGTDQSDGTVYRLK